MKANYSYYAYDTETSVYPGQKTTEIWASTRCPIRTKKMIDKGYAKPERKDCVTDGSFGETLKWVERQKRSIKFEVHNLKFDGTYIADWLFRNGWAYKDPEYVQVDGKWKIKEEPKTFHCLIGDMGQWYTMTLHLENGKTLELRDFLKLCNFSLEKAGKDFQTEHRKLEMNYNGERYENCEISVKEAAYIQNDVLVLSELVEAFFEMGINSLTDAGMAIKNYKTTIPSMYWQENYCNLVKCKLFYTLESGTYYCGIGKKDYGTYVDDNHKTVVKVSNIDEYIRKGYHGGWCYVKKDIQGKVIRVQSITFTDEDGNKKEIIPKYGVFDVNSLYPSMLHSSSGNRYPIGLPHMFDGKEFKKYRDRDDLYYFIRVKLSFKVKKKHLPFIQIKNTKGYRGNEMLEDSYPRDSKGKKVKKLYSLSSGNTTNIVELTLSKTDWELMLEQYDIDNVEILDGVWFYTDIGMFDDYINYWMEIKKTSTGARRMLAKLALNSLYGRFAISVITVSKKLKYENGKVTYERHDEPDKDPLYIAVAAACTSYARAFTVRAAQANYDNFCYADTDSIHCTCGPDKVKGIRIDSKELSCWKCETCWDTAKFVRQKTYIEHTTHEDLKPCKPYWNIKACGMPDNCKELLRKSMEESEEKRKKEECKKDLLEGKGGIFKPITDEDKEKDMIYQKHLFLSKRRTIDDFEIGLQVPGKLVQTTIPGGVLLEPSMFTMKETGLIM